jgi:hypothetical protein
LGKSTVRWMLGVKDAGMMGEGIRLADCRDGTMRAVAMFGDFVLKIFFREIRETERDIDD